MKTKPEQQIIYLSWHFTTHGLAYLKHILSAFYAGIVAPDNLKASGISQEEMNLVFVKKNTGFLFNKVYYLTSSQNVFDQISSRHFLYKTHIFKDELVEKEETKTIWERVLDLNLESLEKEIQYVKTHFEKKEAEKWQNQIWRAIHHYSIADQLWWFRKYSNAHQNYKMPDFFEEIDTKVEDLRNQLEIAMKLKPIIDSLKLKHPNAQFIINATLGSNETQVVWQVLSELNFLPEHTNLIRCYDDKLSKPKTRFKDFAIEEIPSKLISHISGSLKLYEQTPKSDVKQLAELKMKQYLTSGFAILIIGERGIGKSLLAEKHKTTENFVAVNCASFADDSMAESELFGHKKGAFTGANADKIGLFKLADKGILFLDEIHHLSLRVQAKLMKAIQTDSDNYLTIRRLNDTESYKVQTTLIFASNQKISKLRKSLMEDFYDRISQQVIELPALREASHEIPNEFEKIWRQLKFEQFYDFNTFVKIDKKLLEWLRTLSLNGNYRDLQKIAIFYKNYLDFNKNVKKLLPEKSGFEFTKSEFEKYISTDNSKNEIYVFFSENKTVQEMEKDFKHELAKWAIQHFKTAAKAAEHFKELGGNTAKETLYNWRNNSISY